MKGERVKEFKWFLSRRYLQDKLALYRKAGSLCCFFKRRRWWECRWECLRISEPGPACPAESRTAEQTPSLSAALSPLLVNQKVEGIPTERIPGQFWKVPRIHWLNLRESLAIKYFLPCIWDVLLTHHQQECVLNGVFSIRLIALFWTVRILLPKHHSIYFTVDLNK